MWGDVLKEFELKNGTVKLEQEGLLTVIEARIREMRAGITRLAALCGENVRPIGVLIPDGNGLFLRRRLSKAEWTAMGLTEITGFTLLADVTRQVDSLYGEKKRPPAEKRGGLWFKNLDMLSWQTEEKPESCFADPALSRAAAKVRGVLRAEQDGMIYLAVPMNSGSCFPPLPVFRYGEPARIGGESCVVFRLKEGELFA